MHVGSSVVQQLFQSDNITLNGQSGHVTKIPSRSITVVKIYETFVTMACSCFRVDSPYSFPVCGTKTECPGTTGLVRCDLMVEIFKVLYVLKARSSLAPDDNSSPPDLKAIRSLHAQILPSEAEARVALPVALIDYHLHVVLVELLLLPPTRTASHKGIYTCQLHALQLLSAVPPHPEVFSRVLEVVYGQSLTAPARSLPVSDKSSSTSLCAASDTAVDSNTVLALHLVTPLISSLLRILKLQILAAEEISSGVTGSGDNERIAALLIPILVGTFHYS